MSTTFTAQTPTGTVTRTSEGRTYSHAIIALDKDGWGAVAWAGREDLAAKQVAHWSKVSSFTEVRMVPAVAQEKKPRAAKAAKVELTKDEIEMIASAVERSQDAIAEKPAKAKTPKAKTPAKSSGMVKGSDEWKAERKIVKARRDAGESWAAIAKDLGITGVGLRNRYIDLVPSK